MMLERFAPSRNKIYTMIGAVAVALSFGILYPPLALIIAISIITMVCTHQYIIQLHINECNEHLNMDTPSIIANIHSKSIQRSYLCIWLESDCNLLYLVYSQSFYCIIICASFFYALYLFDLTGGNADFAYVIVSMSIILSITSAMYWYIQHPSIPNSIYRYSTKEATMEKENDLRSVSIVNPIGRQISTQDV